MHSVKAPSTRPAGGGTGSRGSGEKRCRGVIGVAGRATAGLWPRVCVAVGDGANLGSTESLRDAFTSQASGIRTVLRLRRGTKPDQNSSNAPWHDERVDVCTRSKCDCF